MANKLRVLVVGGGIAGMCFATAARQREIEVDLVEISPTVLGFGIVLTGSTLLALEHLGLAHACARLGWPIPLVRLFDSDGCFVADSLMPRIAAADLPVCCAISRPVLAAILAESASRLGTQIRIGITIDEIEHVERKIRVCFSNKTRSEYDVVVGADGSYSRVRQLTFSKAVQPKLAGQGAWRFLTERHNEVSQFLLFSSGPLKTGFVPLNEESMYVWSTVRDASRVRVEPQLAPQLYSEVLREFGAPLVREMCARLETADAATVLWRPFETLLMERWSQGNVVLIGDAAHAVSPHISSGGGMAIEDAVVLASHLTEAAPIEILLKRFNAQRIERVRRVYDVSLAICREECSENPSTDKIYKLTMQGYNELAQPFMEAPGLRTALEVHC